MTAFDAEIRSSGRGSHAVVVPRSVVAELGTRRVLVRVGSETFETTLGTYGGRTFLGLRKPVLTSLGLSAGDTVHVDLEPAPATEGAETGSAPVTCAELDAALEADAALHEAWQRLPITHRDEYGRWISTADPAERGNRVARLRHRLLPA